MDNVGMVKADIQHWFLYACAQMCLHPFEYTRAHPHTHAKNNLNITRAEHYQREEPQISNGKKKIKSISSPGVWVSLWPIVNWLDGWVDDRQTDRNQAGR